MRTYERQKSSGVVQSIERLEINEILLNKSPTSRLQSVQPHLNTEARRLSKDMTPVKRNNSLSDPIMIAIKQQNAMEENNQQLIRYRRHEKHWRKLCFILMPLNFLNILSLNIVAMYSPRQNIDGFNVPEVILNIFLIFFGTYSIIKSVKTVMLFSCILYFAFGIMYAYQEVLMEMRQVISIRNVTEIMQLNPPLTMNQLVLKYVIKYFRIFGTLCIIANGLALYAIRRVKIIRAIGNLKNEQFKVVYRRVNSFKLSYKANDQDIFEEDSFITDENETDDLQKKNKDHNEDLVDSSINKDSSNDSNDEPRIVLKIKSDGRYRKRVSSSINLNDKEDDDQKQIF
ncbi:UNKNOWN [Stylonychia lemnae]|uniref:Transmembrane protein n=1 Tax=Stylonychia lemnae TaxID=5949 RepID=A0A078AU67_STYLE|nr:UNKNOWN [Stylonychia lemnae]|eukprot:CDW85531.1 UNKNOWN [Stylonychia lemnae]